MLVVIIIQASAWRQRFLPLLEWITDAHDLNNNEILCSVALAEGLKQKWRLNKVEEKPITWAAGGDWCTLVGYILKELVLLDMLHVTKKLYANNKLLSCI